MTPQRWAAHQPKDGDLILICGHEDEETYHWYALDVDEQGAPAPMQFTRAVDGTEGEATWACICDRCNSRMKHRSDLGRMLRTERVWTGNDPVIPAGTGRELNQPKN
jgi:hypothetical protein